MYCSFGILEFVHSEWYESHCPSATVGSFINWWHKLADITYTSVTLCLKKSNSIKTLSISSQPHLSAMINLRKTTLVFLICCDRVKSRILHHQVPKLVFHVPVMLLSYFRILLPVHCFIKRKPPVVFYMSGSLFLILSEIVGSTLLKAMGRPVGFVFRKGSVVFWAAGSTHGLHTSTSPNW